MIFFDVSAAIECTKDRKHGWAPVVVCPTGHHPHKRSGVGLFFQHIIAVVDKLPMRYFRALLQRFCFLTFQETKICHISIHTMLQIYIQKSVVITDNASTHKSAKDRALTL